MEIRNEDIRLDIKDIIRGLYDIGIYKVEISYSGGHDDGYFEDPQFFDEKGNEVKKVKWEKITKNFTNDDLLDLVYQDQGRLNKFYTFAGEFDVNGTLSINTKNGNYTDSGEESTWQSYEMEYNLFKEPDPSRY